MTPARIQPPILIGQDVAYDFFASIEDASLYVEPCFPATAPAYRAFDASTRRLRLVIDTVPTKPGRIALEKSCG